MLTNVSCPSSSVILSNLTPYITLCVSDKPESWSTEGPSLAESAAAQEAKLARPDFQEVEVKTGEEDESNVFQVWAVLFEEVGEDFHLNILLWMAI